MKHSPFATWRSGDLIQAVPFYDPAIHQWHTNDDDDLDDEIGILSHEEIVQHKCHDGDEESDGHLSIIRIM